MSWVWKRLKRRDVALFAFGTTVYVVTRLLGLTRFPIYFFCDEAVQATLADGLIHNGFRSTDGVLLPAYLLNDTRYNLGLTVYLQAPAVALFGTTVAATRATSVIVGFLAVGAIALIIKAGLSLRIWWISPLVLASIPAWFLHSRTAFEVVMMVSFYACFLASYTLYRCRSAGYAALTIAFGAATFYSYANGQGLMLATGLLVAISDLAYHRTELRVRRVGLPAVGMLAVAALPYLRERTLHPDSFSRHLRSLDSYWFDNISLHAKLWTFVRTYLRGLDPWYWFSSDHTVDLSRHVMQGMGHVWWPLLPFVAIGLVVCVRNWRSSVHRLVLIAVVSAPFSSALVEIQITRVLVTIVPITLLCCVGIEQVLRWVHQPAMYRAVAMLFASALTALSIGTMQTALADGPLWYSDYGLNGMQWGASEVFGELDERLANDSDLQVVVSPSWANNTNSFVPFFIAQGARDRVTLTGVDTFLLRRVPLDPATLFVLTPEDHQAAIDSDKLVVASPDLVIDWPDGRPGFYFTRLRYVDDVDRLFARDEARRQRLEQTETMIDGEAVTVAHNVLDRGQVADIFDGDANTLMRGLEANPFLVELEFAGTRSLTSLELTTATMDYRLVVVIMDVEGTELSKTTATYRGLPADPTVTVDFDGATLAAHRIRLEITQLDVGEIAHIHVRELRLF